MIGRKRKIAFSSKFWRAAIVMALMVLVIWLLFVIESNIDVVATSAPASPNALFDAIFNFIIDYRYAALVAVIFASAIGVPIAGGAAAVTAFVLANDGFMSVPLIAIAAFAANAAGDLAAFAIVRRLGRPIARRLHLERVIEAPVAQRFAGRLERRPTVALVISRLTTSLTPIANIIAGLSGVGWRKFVIAVIIGQAAEVVVNLGLADLFGDSWPYISKITGEIAGIVLALAACIIVIIWRRRRVAT